MIPRTLSALLSLVGLMRIAEHEAASFRIQCQAAEALNEIEYLKSELWAADNLARGYQADALLWRKARDKRSHDRKDSKKGVSRG